MTIEEELAITKAKLRDLQECEREPTKVVFRIDGDTIAQDIDGDFLRAVNEYAEHFQQMIVEQRDAARREVETLRALAGELAEALRIQGELFGAHHNMSYIDAQARAGLGGLCLECSKDFTRHERIEAARRSYRAYKQDRGEKV